MNSLVIKVKSKSVKISIQLLSIVLFLSFFVDEALAQGDLFITPKRVVFEGSKRSEQINLANIGKDTATFVISFIQIRMKPDGAFEIITQPDSGQYFADKNIRFFPHSVTLAPNEAQTVKVQITKTNQLVPGEYRSHLYFRAVPKENPLGEKPPVNVSDISVVLVPVFGISIPLIIHSGASTTTVNFSDINFEMGKDTMPLIKMNFNRAGNMSAYGDLFVDHISTTGKVTHVGSATGLAVYTPNTVRHFQLLLSKNAGVDYGSGKLHVVYSDQSMKAVKMAEGEISLH